MRYLLQFSVMLSELVILAAIVIVGYFAVINADWFCGSIALLGLWAWHQTGIFFSWRPTIIKAFLANAKRYGL